MLLGIRLKANPTAKQKEILSQWMGCARFIWNAKCEEHKYYTAFAKKYFPIGTYAPIDQKTSQFKSKELSPWLYDCPSQILRNSAFNWFQTYKKFMQGICGKPRRKPKSDKGSVHLTKELFKFEICSDGVTRLFIGTKTKNIGYLSFKTHKKYKKPNSIYIKKQAGCYYISFCYESSTQAFVTEKEHLEYLKKSSKAWLNKYTIGIDRGVAIPVHAGENQYDFTWNQKKNKKIYENHLRKLQKKLTSQTKGSKRRNITKISIARKHKKIFNIRQDFCHQTSRKIINSCAKVIIFEALKTANMTKRPKPKQDNQGKYISNKASQKSGLNKAILDIGWHYIERYTNYKAKQAGKAVFKISAHYTSQECANCSHTHPNNRKTQSLFNCDSCGHIDNADKNASLVIKNRAIKMILDSGTELVGKGIPVLTSGRGAKHKTSTDNTLLALGRETSKKKIAKVASVAA
jgi:putative transposase